MIAHLLASDRLKMRKSWIPVLILLGPLGVIGLQIPNYALRKGLDQSGWTGLFQNIDMLMYYAFMMGITLLASIAAGTEHQANAWKQLFALPISRLQLYASKAIWIFGLLLISCLLTSLGTGGIGVYLGFENIPWAMAFQNTFFTLFAALPFLAIQLWLSMIYKNQAAPITYGVLGSLILGGVVPDWLPWKYPYLVMKAVLEQQSSTAIQYVLLGILLGILLLLLGAYDFTRRDVK
jgi:hypothetical protein